MMNIAFAYRSVIEALSEALFFTKAKSYLELG
jgi:hypothetical protein